MEHDKCLPVCCPCPCWVDHYFCFTLYLWLKFRLQVKRQASTSLDTKSCSCGMSQFHHLFLHVYVKWYTFDMTWINIHFFVFPHPLSIYPPQFMALAVNNAEGLQTMFRPLLRVQRELFCLGWNGSPINWPTGFWRITRCILHAEPLVWCKCNYAMSVLNCDFISPFKWCSWLDASGHISVAPISCLWWTSSFDITWTRNFADIQCGHHFETST